MHDFIWTCFDYLWLFTLHLITKEAIQYKLKTQNFFLIFIPVVAKYIQDSSLIVTVFYFVSEF